MALRDYFVPIRFPIASMNRFAYLKWKARWGFCAGFCAGLV